MRIEAILSLSVLSLWAAIGCSVDSTTGGGRPDTFSTTDPLLQERMNHTATLLANGSVLVAGGVRSVFGSPEDRLTSTEIFEPSVGAFRSGLAMPQGRTEHCAVRLADGRVFWVGGGVAEVSIYDPESNRFAEPGPTSAIETVRESVLLPDGRVLILGDLINFAEVYDPSANTITTVGPVGARRVGHSATLLPGGGVFIMGGATTTLAERFEPPDNRFFTVSENARILVSRYGHQATLLADGRVLIAGGSARVGGSLFRPISAAELYDPGTKTFQATGSMAVPRFGHEMSLLPDGKVLVIGGSGEEAEVYDPDTGVFSTVSQNEGRIRSGATSTVLSDGRVLVVGGLDEAYALRQEAILYNP